jgi:hypothetical protein
MTQVFPAPVLVRRLWENAAGSKSCGPEVAAAGQATVQTREA